MIGMIIDIDPTLQPAEYRYLCDLQSVIEATIQPDRPSMQQREFGGESRPSTTERMVRHSLPYQDCRYHSNYMSYLISNWSQHHPIVLNPDIVWFAVMHEIAQGVVQAPDPHRSMFTRSPERITIKVMVGAVDDPLPLDAVTNELRELVPVDVDLFLPKFTTTTEMARLTHLTSFAETC
jgi:hypothetical protein